MKKIIEVVKDGRILATYDWETKVFSYDSGFFSEKGDYLYATDGLETKKFDDTPRLFRRYMPVKGSTNYSDVVDRFGADPNDEFDVICKVGGHTLASFQFRESK
jgi:hypothetical protein